MAVKAPDTVIDVAGNPCKSSPDRLKTLRGWSRAPKRDADRDQLAVLLRGMERSRVLDHLQAFEAGTAQLRATYPLDVDEGWVDEVRTLHRHAADRPKDFHDAAAWIFRAFQGAASFFRRHR